MLRADAPAAAAVPGGEDFDGCALIGEGGEDEGALQGVVRGQRRVGHEEAVNGLVGAGRVPAGGGGADGVGDGPGDDGFSGGGLGVADLVAEDGAGKAGGFGVEGLEGGESFKGELDGAVGVGELDVGDGEPAVECGLSEAREAGDVG